ncbi:murein hydrolase activator EnvC family protein [uncultured Microbacterium sp.]|uniref:murein hydrolase activator EnvC family protein n=1 Tax=uncultured Microbacterium sp. TaxID=191216 RepID=UPI0035CAB0DD
MTRVSAAVLVMGIFLGTAVTGASASAPSPAGSAGDLRSLGWVWPLAAVVTAPYVAPPHPYGAGHRGIDLAGDIGAPVRAPAAGTIAYVGAIAGRGIVTIDHGDGLVTTFEPVESTLEAGAAVARGEEVATISVGGHAAPSTLHFGVRLNGEYINPMLLLDSVPRAVLLPCC